MNNYKEKTLVIQNGAYIEFPEFAKYSQEINRLYCKKWGYEYIFIEHRINEAPPYWLKVLDVYEKMQTNRYDKIIYLDLDACFTEFDLSLEEVLYKAGKYDLYIGKDCNPNSLCNTGVFVFRNTKIGREILQLWKNACFSDTNTLVNSCKLWNFEGNKWYCDDKGKDCVWAGLNYEQGKLGEILTKYPYNCVILHESYFSNRFPENKSYIIHLMAQDPNVRKKIFSNILYKIKSKLATSFSY